MGSFLSIIAVGFFLGMRHATDPDHVIAVTTIVTRQRQLTRAALTGAFWGVGHTLTIFVVGALIILFDVVIPTRLGLSMEFSVALMLIVLGIMNVAAFMRSARSLATDAHTDSKVLHAHPHAHGDYVHSHAHGHVPEAHPHRADRTPLALLDRLFGKLALYRPVRPFIVGVVHGLAGSAAVALLVLAAIPNPRWAVVYSARFWSRNCRRHDADHHEHCLCFQVYGKGQAKILTSPWIGFRPAQSGIRNITGLSDRVC